MKSRSLRLPNQWISSRPMAASAKHLAGPIVHGPLVAGAALASCSRSRWRLPVLLALVAGTASAQTPANGVNDFNSAATDYTYLSPGSVDTLTANRIARVAFFATPAAQTIDLGATNTLTLAGIDNQGGALTIQRGGSSTGTVVIGDGNLLTVSGTSDVLISAVISGLGGSLNHLSIANLVLAGVNTYTGGTNVNAGTVQIGNGVSGAISNTGGASVAAGATLAFNMASGSYGGTIANHGTVAGLEGAGLTNTLSGVISGTGGFTQAGAGTSILSSNASSFTGNVLIPAGLVRLTGGLLGVNPVTSPLGNTQFAGRTITVGAGATLRFDENDAFGNADSAPVVPVRIGGTVISKSKLTTLGPIELEGGRLTADGGLNFGGSAIGSINLNGAVTVRGTVPSTMDATTAANSRYLLNNIGSRITPFDVADVTGDSATDLTLSGIVANPWDFAVDKIAAGLSKSGAGTLALGHSGSSFTGNVAIDAGTLAVTAGLDAPVPVTSALGNPGLAGRTVTVAAGAVLSFQASDGLGNAFGAPQVRLIANGGTIVSRGSLTTLGGVTLSGGTLTADGGLNFGGSDIGSVALNGTITVAGSAPSRMNDTGAPNSRFLLSGMGSHVTTFEVAEVTNDAAPDLTVSTVIANPWGSSANGWLGGLAKTGAGTLVLGAANLYTGPTTVHAGALLLDGTLSGSPVTVQAGATLGGQGTVKSLMSAGIISPSDPLTPGLGIGSLSSISDVLLGGETRLDLHKDEFWLSSDFLLSDGLIVYGGALTISATGDALASGDVFHLFEAPSLTNGMFDSITLPALSGSLTWDVSNLRFDGTIAVVPEPGSALLLLGGLGLLALRRRPGQAGCHGTTPA